MTKLWCKMWNFFLNIFTSIIEGVGIILKTIGTVFVDVLSTVAGAVGDALGIGSLFLWIGVGVLAYYVITNDDDDDKGKVQVTAHCPTPTAVEPGAVE